ncbi:unnamed protein product [Schistosoma mattheei]|uniref:Uncharacterized protein n=1 Tax=Schistosoma mattheei TaxID=31246 RepID=A0A183P5J5_9TREM|nr:unnamed protein product [Schistosoma mattheei]
MQICGNHLESLQSIRNEELSRELLHQTAEQKSVLTFLANKNTEMKTKELPRFEKELDRVEVMLGTTAYHKKNAKINSTVSVDLNNIIL